MHQQHITSYLDAVKEIAEKVNKEDICSLIKEMESLKRFGGRLFIIGVGGSAGTASHAVNDFRKIVGIESYAPTDNVSELTARANDEGWDTTIWKWLEVSKLDQNDAILVFSVGGGSDHTSYNLVKAMEYAKSKGSKILSIVSRDGGKSKELSDCCILIPVINQESITPHAEEWQGIIWHMVVSYFMSVKDDRFTN